MIDDPGARCGSPSTLDDGLARDLIAWTVVNPAAPMPPSAGPRPATTASQHLRDAGGMAVGGLVIMGLLWSGEQVDQTSPTTASLFHVARGPAAIALVCVVLGFLLMAGLTARRERSRWVTRQARQQWEIEEQITRADLPEATRARVDRWVGSVQSIRHSRAAADAWIDPEWLRHLQTHQWELCVRLRDSAAVREHLAQAAALTDVRSAELDRQVAARTADVQRLDDELDQALKQVETLASQTRRLDAVLGADELARRLDTAAPPIPSPPAVPALNPLTGDDLTLLGAQLDALIEHVARPAVPTAEPSKNPIPAVRSDWRTDRPCRHRARSRLDQPDAETSS